MSEFYAPFNKYDTMSMHGFEGCCFRNNDSDGYSRYIMAFLNDTTPKIIAHECLHFVGYLFEDRGINFSTTNDEPQCYLLDWAVGECHKFLEVG